MRSLIKVATHGNVMTRSVYPEDEKELSTIRSARNIGTTLGAIGGTVGGYYMMDNIDPALKPGDEDENDLNVGAVAAIGATGGGTGRMIGDIIGKKMVVNRRKKRGKNPFPHIEREKKEHIETPRFSIANLF